MAGGPWARAATTTPPTNTALTPIAEYYGVMIGQDRRLDQLTDPTAMFRGYSLERRDQAPLIETEDFRDEAARRFWDDYSPPHFGFKKGPNDTWNLGIPKPFASPPPGAITIISINRISNPDPAHSKMVGLRFDLFVGLERRRPPGQQRSLPRQRQSGCRAPAQGGLLRLSRDAKSRARTFTSSATGLIRPTLSKRSMSRPTIAIRRIVRQRKIAAAVVIQRRPNGYIFAFPDIAFEPGAIKAVATADGQVVAQEEIQTAGEAKALKLTAHTGPNGLQADGSDVAFFDVEVVDAQGRRCPTDEARVDFKVDGPAIWRGGYNSGSTNSSTIFISTPNAASTAWPFVQR